MSDEEMTRVRPSGPPPSSVEGLTRQPEPAQEEPQQAAPEVPEPANVLASGKVLMGRLGNAVGALVAVVALVAVAVLAVPPFLENLRGFVPSPAPSSKPVDPTLYDFTQSIPEGSSIGPLDEVTVRVPDGLASAVPGYTEGHYLKSVKVSNVQYVEADPSWLRDGSLCSVDLGFVWNEDVIAAAVPDLEHLVRWAGMSTSGEGSQVTFSEDFSTATTVVTCDSPSTFGGKQNLGFTFQFTAVNGKGEPETKTLARVSLALTDNGKIFVLGDLPGKRGVEGWQHLGGYQWEVRYGG